MFVFQGHTNEWRRYRKAFHTQIMASMLPKYYSVQEQVTTHLLYNLATTPKDFSNHIRLYVLTTIRISTVLKLTHGH